jgi:hypothetical protein
MACTEKNVNVFCGKMEMSCGCFNENFVFHWSISHFLDGNRRVLLYTSVSVGEDFSQKRKIGGNGKMSISIITHCCLFVKWLFAFS